MNRGAKTANAIWLFTFLITGLASLILLSSATRLVAGTANPQSVSSNPQIPSEDEARRILARDLTTRLVELGTRYQLTSKSERALLKADLRVLAARRHEMLARLIESDPAEVLQEALPDELRARLPDVIRDDVEQRVEFEGKLEVLSQCSDQESRLLYFANVNGERLSLRFASNPATDLLTGALVQVKGVRIGDTVVLATPDELQSNGLQTMAPAYPNTFGEQHVLVLLVNFQDKQTQPYTLQQARDLVFGTVNNYYREASYQQTWLTGDAFGWFTLPINSGDCSGTQIATYAKEAASAAGVNLSAYNRYVYVFPSMSCGYTGWAQIGGNPSEAWINGSLILRTVAHELGHCFGLYHSTAMDCHPSVIGSGCHTVEYGDILDMMGKPGVTGHFNSYQKERLGWLNYGSSAPITTVQASGSYWVDPYEPTGPNSKGLRILRSTDTYGRKTWYYVEFRRPIGFDSFISSNSNVMNGVMIHTGTDTSGYIYLLDMTPETTSWSDAALDVGRSYNDPSIGMTITPVSVDNSGAAVSVSFGPVPCVRANPSLNLSPSESQWIRGGSSATYTVLVTNNDNSGCSTSSFSLQATVPSGWTATFASQTLNISPGASVTTTLQITSPPSTPDGFYSVGVTASNNSSTSNTALASGTCVVVSSLAVTVSTDQPTYTRSQTATMTALVSGAGSPVSGASVTFTVTKPDGSSVTGISTTSANGSAGYLYRFNRKRDPLGTYQVSVIANINGVSGRSTTNFTVR